MKHLVIAAIALAGFGPALATPAAAQHRVVVHRTVVHEGPRRAFRTRRVCTTAYHHHRRVRTCRVVRDR